MHQEQQQYDEPAVDSFDEAEIVGDAPALATLQTQGSGQGFHQA